MTEETKPGPILSVVSSKVEEEPSEDLTTLVGLVRQLVARDAHSTAISYRPAVNEEREAYMAKLKAVIALLSELHGEARSAGLNKEAAKGLKKAKRKVKKASALLAGKESKKRHTVVDDDDDDEDDEEDEEEEEDMDDTEEGDDDDDEDEEDSGD